MSENNNREYFIETVGWINDSEWNVKMHSENPIDKESLKYRSDYFNGDDWLYKSANRHIIKFINKEDAEECLKRIEVYRNSEPTPDPFEKGETILSPE